MKYGNLYVN